MTRVKHSSDDGISGEIWVAIPTNAVLNGKLACICYGPDTPPSVTEAYVNMAIGYTGGWTQGYQWQLGDGDPGLCVPDGVELDDPRVVELFNALYSSEENGIYLFEPVDNYDCMTICASTDDAVLLFVDENASALFPELEGE